MDKIDINIAAKNLNISIVGIEETDGVEEPDKDITNAKKVDKIENLDINLYG